MQAGCSNGPAKDLLQILMARRHLAMLIQGMGARINATCGCSACRTAYKILVIIILVLGVGSGAAGKC